MLLVLALLHSSALVLAKPCDAVGICQCQTRCSINGFWVADGHPDCNASVDGSPANVMDADILQTYGAAVLADEEQAICDLLHCKLQCLQHCRVQLQSFVDECEKIRSLVPTCSIHCGANQMPPATRELAVCLVGQLRGICQAEDLSSLFNVVLDNFESVDVFLVFPDPFCQKDVALFKEAASIFHHNDLRIFPFCQPDELNSAELDFQDWFQNHEWWAKNWHAKGYGGNKTSALMRLMLANKHITACAKEVLGRSEEYRFVSRIRPDVGWVSFIDRRSLEMSVPGRVLANFVAMPIQGVVEDTFSIGSPDDMEKYFSFYEKQILDVENLEQTNSPWCVAHAALRDDTHCKKIFPENLLEEHLRRQHLQLQKRQDICFERLAPCMQPRNHYCTRFKQHPRGYSQSNSKRFLEGDRDFFLTASGSYADYDTILAARLVHFFLSEAARLGHPPRILDMGCGRGSYVEVFKSWGLPVMGIDGNSVITRSVRVNSFLWDLTEPLDLKKAFEKEECHFYWIQRHTEAEKEFLQHVQSVAGQGVLQLYMFAVVPRLDATHFWASKHPEGHPEDVLMKQTDMANYLHFLCCADKRCAAFAFTEMGGALLAWALANSTENIRDFEPTNGNVWYQANRKPLINASNIFDIDGPGDFPTFELQYAEMEVSFSTADWVVSLGVGVEIPRMGEKVFVENLVKHVEQGVVISWGSQGQNPRSVAEVLEIFQKHQLELDVAATSSLKFFSGLVHAPEREDLLILRKVSTFAKIVEENSRLPTDIQLIDEWGGDRCVFGGNLQHGLQGEKSQFGPLGSGRMWVSGNCVGFFRAGDSGETVLCTSQHKKFQECKLPGLGQDRIAESGPDMDTMEVSALYDLADHMVPTEGIWLGNSRLNLVFFKITRAIAAPSRWTQLHSAWTWFWSSSWQTFLAPPEPHRVFTPWAKTVAPGLPMWQTGRVILALHQLSCRLRRQSDEEAEKKTISLQRVFQSLEALELASSEVTSSTVAASLVEVQKEVKASVADFNIKEVLLDPVFSDEILPRLWMIFSSELPEGTGGLGLIYREAGCKDPVWDEPVNLASLWDKESATGWYLYRLAAVDPSM